MRLADQLRDYINAAFTGIYVQSHEPDEAQREILQLAKNRKWRVASWDVAHGLRLFANDNQSAPNAYVAEPLAALRALPSLADPDSTTILLLHNFHRFLNT